MSDQTNPSRRLAAILFADIVGYTALMQEAEHVAASLLRKFQDEMRSKVEQLNGSIVNEMGDGMLCVFDSPPDAVRCAIALNEAFGREPKVPVRIGIHSGTVVFEGDKVYGNSVNIAGRIESMGVPGAVLISRRVRTEIKNHPDLLTSSLGTFHFKNVDEPLEVYAITNEGIVIPERKQLQGKFKQKRSVFSSLWLAVIGIAIAVGSYVGYKSLTEEGPSAEMNTKSIAVLPFENMSGEDDAYFAAGIAEDILTQISKIGDLKVISRFTLKEYDADGKTPAEIGDELKVAHLLAGSIRRVGTDLRIACQLINTDDQTETWAQTFDRQFKNIFAIQSEIAQKVAGQLKAKLSAEEKQLMDHRPTENLEAYNHFLKGRDIFNSNNGVANDKSIEYFKKAIELDSTFELAWAALSTSYSLAVYSYGTRPTIYLDTALLFGQKAIDLNPDESHGWVALGLAHDVLGQYEMAEPLYYKALELNPNNGSAISNLAIILKEQGRIASSISMQRKSIERDPLSARSYNTLAINYRQLEMYDKALEQLELALALDPDSWITLYYIAYNHVLNETPEEAVPFIERMVELDPDNARFLEIAGELSHYFDPVTSRKYFEKALQSRVYDPEINFFTPVGIGYYLWEEGKIDSANVWLEASLQQQDKFIEGGSEALNPIMIKATVHAIRGEKEKALELLREINPISLDFKSWALSPMSSRLHHDQEFMQLIDVAMKRIAKMRDDVIMLD